MANQVLPFFWLAAHNRDLKLIDSRADWYSSRNNDHSGNHIACSETAGGMCRHRSSVVSYEHSSGFGCPSKELRVWCLAHSDFIRRYCVEIRYATQQTTQEILVKVLINQ